MAYVNWRTRGRNSWVPANYNANEADTGIIAVEPGDVVQSAFSRIDTGFAATSAAILLGDGNDPNGFLDAGDITEATAAVYGPGDGAYIKEGLYLYTVADLVSVAYNVGAADATGVGVADFWIWVAKAEPR